MRKGKIYEIYDHLWDQGYNEKLKAIKEEDQEFRKTSRIALIENEMPTLAFIEIICEIWNEFSSDKIVMNMIEFERLLQHCGDVSMTDEDRKFLFRLFNQPTVGTYVRNNHIRTFFVVC